MDTKSSSAPASLLYNTDNYMDLKNPELRRAKKELLKESYSPVKRAQEITCFVLFSVLFPLAVYNVCIQKLGWTHVPAILIGAFFGICFSDFLSGLVHWAADTWGNIDWPFFGRTFIRSFREHHVAPAEMCNHDFIETNGDNLLTLLIPLFLLCTTDLKRNSSDGVTPPVFDVATYCFWVFTALGVAFTNQIHKWSHTFRPPAVVAWLQNSGLILSKENHTIHHRPAFDGHYCITTGWLNPILDNSQFWRHFEAVVSALTGLKPREDDYKWTGLVDETPAAVQQYVKQKQEREKADKAKLAK